MESEDELREYLLGGLTARARERIEERLFLDRKFFRQLESAEDDLIDEYVSGELAADEREKFRHTLLSDPARRADIRIARALKKYIDAETEPEPLVVDVDASEEDSEESDRATAPPAPGFVPRPFWRPSFFRAALAAAFVVVAVVGLWLIYRAARRSAQPPAPIARVPETPQPDVSPAAINSNTGAASPNTNAVPPNQTPTPERVHEKTNTGRHTNSAPPPPRRLPQSTYATFTLVPLIGVRAEGEPEPFKLAIPSDAVYVTLQLPLLDESDHPNYEATLLTDEGSPLKVWPNLKRRGAKGARAIHLPPVPAKLLRPHSYRIELKGGDPQGDLTTLHTYPFQVTAR